MANFQDGSLSSTVLFCAVTSLSSTVLFCALPSPLPLLQTFKKSLMQAFGDVVMVL